MKLGCSVALAEVFKIFRNSLESHTDMSVSVFVKDLIVFIEGQDFLFFPKISDFMVGNIFEVIEEGSVMIVPDKRTDRVIGTIQDNKGGEWG